MTNEVLRKILIAGAEVARLSKLAAERQPPPKRLDLPS